LALLVRLTWGKMNCFFIFVCYGLWCFYFYQHTMTGLLWWTNPSILGQEFGMECWNILNYHWGFFQDTLGIFYYYIIPNNILDKIPCDFFLSLYNKWMSCIISNNILDINLIQVFHPCIKMSNKSLFLIIFWILTLFRFLSLY
jgi:hypothetical protein